MTGESERARARSWSARSTASSPSSASPGTAPPWRAATRTPSAVRSRVERLDGAGRGHRRRQQRRRRGRGRRSCARGPASRAASSCTSRAARRSTWWGPAGPRLLERREATSLEEEQLAATAEALRDRLAAAGLDVVLVRDHLNRRSIDLVPGWPEPPGADVAELRRAGRASGCARPASPAACTECMELAREMGREAGLAYPAVTSDVRHIDIGLTGKSDAMHAVTRALVDGARPAAAGPAGARRHLRGRGGRAGHRLRHAHPRAAPRRVRQRRRGAGRGAAAGAARRRRPDRVPRHPARPARDARDRRAAELPRAERRPGLAVRGQGLRPLPRARGRDVAHRRQRRDRHARRARGGLRDLDAGHLRRRRVRRRDRRPALPAAGPGAGLDRPAAHGGRQRRCPSPTARSSSTSACWTCGTASSTATGASGCAAAARVRVRTARFASLADRQVLAARAEATPEDFAGSHQSGRAPSASRTPAGRPGRRSSRCWTTARPDREHARPQRRRARARGDDQSGARLARRAHTSSRRAT